MPSKPFYLTLSTLAIGVGLGIAAADGREFTMDEKRWCQRLVEDGDIATLTAVANSSDDPRKWLASECLAMLALPALPPQQQERGDGASISAFAGIPY